MEHYKNFKKKFKGIVGRLSGVKDNVGFPIQGKTAGMSF